jgi:hypothetical protein
VGVKGWLTSGQSMINKGRSRSGQISPPPWTRPEPQTARTGCVYSARSLLDPGRGREVPPVRDARSEPAFSPGRRRYM